MCPLHYRGFGLPCYYILSRPHWFRLPRVLSPLTFDLGWSRTTDLRRYRHLLYTGRTPTVGFVFLYPFFRTVDYKRVCSQKTVVEGTPFPTLCQSFLQQGLLRGSVFSRPLLLLSLLLDMSH